MVRLLACGTILFSLVASVAADVAPYPAWRVVTNGIISGASQSGGTIYFGGNFSKLGRAVTPFDGFLDLATLSLTGDPGCARDRGQLLGTTDEGTSRLIWRDQLLFGSRLSDGSGPFVVGDDVRYVRVGSDCRFDRQFALRLPVPGALTGVPVYVGDVLYSTVLVGVPFPGSWFAAAFDARTGDLLQGWPVPSSSSLVGVGAGNRLAMTFHTGTALSLGFFDPATGDVTTVDSLPGAAYRTVTTTVGSRVIVAWSINENGQPTTRLDLFDMATWQRAPGWPEVRATSISVLGAASAGRLVVSALGLQVGGTASHRLAAFDLQSGAHDKSWSSPAWLDDPATIVWGLAVTGSRLLVSGDFVAGAERDTIAALDLASGALDDWQFGFATGWTVRAGSRLYLGTVTSTRRMARRHMAAVDARTGDVLPWNPGDLLPTGYGRGVTAFVREGGLVYAAHSGTVSRFDLATGGRDNAWQLDALTFSSLPGTISGLAVGPDVIYATGDFDQARGGNAGPFETRNGGAAISMSSGALSPWNPRVASTCSTGGRFPTFYPCIADVAVTPDRVFLRGSLILLGSTQSRSLLVLTTDTGAPDLAIPTPVTTGITSADGVLHAVVSLDGQQRLVRVDPGLVPTVLPNPLQYGSSHLAARDGRVYAGVELDGVTGAPTGNANYWLHPLAADQGLLEIGVGLAFHSDMTAVRPGTPTDLTPTVSGSRVTLRWNRAATDLQPLSPVPPSGGTAATSHLIAASLTPGGPPIAQLDTASTDTAYTVDAPAGVFFVRVLAKNAFGVSDPSNEVRIDLRPSAPDPPVAAVATVTGRDVRIQWQAAPSGWPTTAYVLEAGSRPGAEDIAVVPVSGIEFRVSNVPPGRYFVRIRAVNANGASGPGQDVVVTVL